MTAGLPTRTDGDPSLGTSSVERSGGVTLAIIGFVVLGAELLLARRGSIVIGADAGGLAWTIGAFLVGNAVGGVLAGRGRGDVRRWSVAALVGFVAGTFLLEVFPALLFDRSLPRAVVRGLGAAIVLIPAIPFGALPVSWYGIGDPDAETTRKRVGGWIAALDLGGALGALALPLVLLPLLGAVVSTVVLAALLVAVVRMSMTVPALARGGEVAAVRADRPTPRALAIAAAIGAGTLAHQLTVTRVLGEILGTSLVVLGVATAATLVGGAFAARLTPRAVQRWGGGPIVAGAAGLWLFAQGVSALAIALLPDLLVGALGSIGAADGAGDGTWAPTLLKAGAVVAVVLPPGLAAGFVLPTLLAAACTDAPTLRRHAGPLEAAWLVGGGIGAWGGALLLLSTLGSGATLAVIAVGTALGAGLAAVRVGEAPRRFRPSVVGVVLLAAVAFGGAALRWDPALLGVGIYAWDRGHLATGEALAGWRDREVTYIGEGRIAKVTIEVASEQNTAYLRVGGRIEGSVAIDPSRPSFADLPTEVLLGLLPAVEGTGRGDLLAIGLGGGTTVATAAEAWEGTVTALEIEPEVARALRSPAGAAAFPHEHAILFPAEGEGPRLVFEDARSFLTRDPRTWGAIICQPSEPWLPWSAPLFTEDFYRLVRGRLAPGGVAIHWVQLYRIAPAEFAAVARAFLEVFPGARAYHPPGTGEIILVGGGESNRAAVARRGLDPAILALWARGARGPFPNPLIDAERLRAWCAVEGADGGGDLRSRLEFRLPLVGDRGVDRASEILRGLRRAAASAGRPGG